MTGDIRLRQGVPGHSGNARFVVRHLWAPDGRPLTVYLVVVADGEREVELALGDTFSVRDETWLLDRVDGLETDDGWRVVLRKVDQHT
ncbi:DUF6406 domain-containing protein [Streptomyces spirodelae]|uniref:Uncharacterized protein n=1 Tax=Streptomyces spirodelae TaxID=2812904 RepID=A0ABS3WXR1_9ACTN|nr:DUF6406 domain-containing protein [Streptomyces spirodelae]MBO8187924.1 hypothetical protein [Streptomyces spirodelae]